MSFKSFRTQVLFRVILALVFVLSATFVLFQTDFWLLSIWLYLGFILSIFSLIRFTEKAHKDLYYFLLSIKEGDFSTSYPYKKKNELNYAFDTINQVLNSLRNEKASNSIYLQTVVEHIGIALLCLDGQKIILHNKAASNLFGLSHLNSIEKLQQIDAPLAATCMQMKHGDQHLVKTKLSGQLYSLSLQCTEFWLQDKHFRLISFQDIKADLEANEIESWQRLIRVLTHEIKNSAIPISTLSEVIIELIEQNKSFMQQLEDGEALSDILGGLETIQTRSAGLVNFVNSYDQLAKVPQPKLEEVDLSTLVEHILKLFKVDVESKQICLNHSIAKNTLVNIDQSLIEQVLINLIKNAIEAIEGIENAQLDLIANETDGQLSLIIKDNGPGMSDEVLENIFVPFYSTKNRGSGIGLSLSRQIMRAHNGNISVSTSSAGSSFTLNF